MAAKTVKKEAVDPEEGREKVVAKEPAKTFDERTKIARLYEVGDDKESK